MRRNIVALLVIFSVSCVSNTQDQTECPNQNKNTEKQKHTLKTDSSLIDVVVLQKCIVHDLFNLYNGAGIADSTIVENSINSCSRGYVIFTLDGNYYKHEYLPLCPLQQITESDITWPESNHESDLTKQEFVNKYLFDSSSIEFSDYVRENLGFATKDSLHSVVGTASTLIVNDTYITASLSVIDWCQYNQETQAGLWKKEVNIYFKN